MYMYILTNTSCHSWIPQLPSSPACEVKVGPTSLAVGAARFFCGGVGYFGYPPCETLGEMMVKIP